MVFLTLKTFGDGPETVISTSQSLEDATGALFTDLETHLAESEKPGFPYLRYRVAQVVVETEPKAVADGKKDITVPKIIFNFE